MEEENWCVILKISLKQVIENTVKYYKHYQTHFSRLVDTILIERN